ncbi:hypothetical protein [Rubrobacter xylanophilus]|uniref:hypothetical protein n=1 Tax=Rubrobacter xylanophilus TaxID=49319 RepID=UPI00003A245D|nr:hypothetical protein [Rubrobacter xylanophilus]
MSKKPELPGLNLTASPPISALRRLGLLVWTVCVLSAPGRRQERTGLAELPGGPGFPGGGGQEMS